MSVSAQSAGPYIDPDSDTAALLTLLEDVTGWSIDEWIKDYEHGPGLQMWHLPAWLAEEHHFPLHDRDLGIIIAGDPHRETDNAVKFDSGVDVLVLQRETQSEHTQNGRTCLYSHERPVYEMDTWQAEVEECVGDDHESSRWKWRYVKTKTYWPFSQITRIY